ncbi:MAG: SDR family oxidoreductase [Candidatus Marinimicrobia bacterium]|jgi:3-oxoacyl-[acyl-carrier protein] reductase|nr:SDR family oxidoreductase [Candidatus Neomarinimicrobiota bacterium]
MNLEIKDKIFLVTGSSRGIGKAIVERLLFEGAKVALVARGEESLNQAVNEFKNRFGEDCVEGWSVDCADEKELQNLQVSIEEKWKRLDGVIANVGDGRSVPDAIPSADQWSTVWRSNFDTALNTSRAFLPMLKATKGCLLFISSITGVEAIGAPIDYSTAKSALNAFAKNLSRKVAPHVRVNVIAPGNIYFPEGSWDKKMKNDEKKISELIKNTVPIQRFGKPEEIADTAVFLCSPRASFITGSVLRVDGGQTVSL